MAQVTIREGLDGATVPDSWIGQRAPTRNHGTETSLQLGVGAATIPMDVRRGLFLFDLSVIPEGATILSAYLTLYANSVSSAAASKVRRVTTSWVESSVTWTKTSPFSNWGTPGGDFTSVDEVDWTFPTSIGDFDIEDMEILAVDAIANRGGFLHGVLMRSVEAADGITMNVDSGEGTTAARRPRLIVDYGYTVHRRRIERY